MISKFRRHTHGGLLWLSLSAILALSYGWVLPQLVGAQAPEKQQGNKSFVQQNRLRERPIHRLLIAQNDDGDGTHVPPPPKIRRRGGGDGADPEFRAPRVDGEGPGGGFRRRAFGAQLNVGANDGQGTARGGGQDLGSRRGEQGLARDGAAGAGADDSDMPGQRMRRRLRQAAAGQAGDAPLQRLRNGGSDMPDRPGKAAANPADVAPANNANATTNGDGPFRRNGGTFAGAQAGGFAGNGAGLRGGYGAPGQKPRQGLGAGGAFGNKALDLRPVALNPDQKARVREMRTQTRLKIKGLHQSIIQKQANLRNLMFSPEASDSQIREARVQLRKLQDQVDETNMNDLLAIRGMLTPEQRKRLPDCMPGRNNNVSSADPASPVAQAQDPKSLPRKRPGANARRYFEAENDNVTSK